MNQKTKRLLSALLTLCLLLGLAACGVKQNDPASPPDSGNDVSDRGTGGADTNENNSDAHYVSLSEDFTDVTVTDETSALNAIRSVGGALGLTDAERELRIRSVHAVDGAVFYRFQQYHDDIPLYGRSIVISANSAGAATALTANYTPIDFTPDLSTAADAEAIGQAIARYFSEEMGWESVEPAIDEESMDDLVIYNMGDGGKAHLACQLNVTVSVDGDGEEYAVLVDYNDGSVLTAQPLCSEAEAEITSKDGKVTVMGTRADDGTYGVFNSEYTIAVVDLESDNSSDLQSSHGVIQSNSNEFPKDAVVALKNGIEIARYFETLGFENYYETQIWINDNWQLGVNARAIPGETENGYRAIVSMGKHMGTSNLDVMAHEYTHNVTSSIVHWTGAKQAQAIYEAYSDIFGELIERHMEGWDAPDWNFSAMLAGRNIAKPEQSSPPTDEVAERTNLVDFSHDYSTVISHAAYLMWNGIDGDPSMKLDCDELARLWYRSIFLLQPDATFNQCSNAVIVAAKQLVQDGVLDARQLSCVKQAFDEVGIETDVADYSLTTNGSTIYALDVKTERSYDNYHLSICRARDFSSPSPSQPGVGESVAEVDIDDYDGYTFDLPDGTYTATVCDNDEGGSRYTYSTTFRVLTRTLDPELDTPLSKPGKINIYTDFRHDNITGVVTDIVTGRPLKDAVVTCEDGEVSAHDKTDENGVYHISGLPRGAYHIYASKDDCEEGPRISVVLGDKTTELGLTLRPFYAQAYADYLMDNQSHDTSASEYALGAGRFALAYITDDQTPELLIIDSHDDAIIYTCEDRTVRNLLLTTGNSDVDRYKYKTILYNEDNLLAAKWSDDGSAPWNIMQYSSFPNSDLIMTARLINRDRQYYVNTYDPDKMYDDGYMYLVYEYEDNPVSQAEYEAAWHGFGLDSDSIRSIEESEVYRIVPEVIREVFACD